ncbi:putative protein kinase [Trypanosoma cruzi]|uniref:Protein kinase, putative n=2 Tax=Trypanosoma cruzi TaxID=5693 RepID=Q4DC42_TRYCC|nr:protein kinase, putative [Trypanosoma cruzi]EAN90089.1 protein kinase, putative [Trypanosoma cruzi]PWV17412.1 putative protein kinase [Trypanosoma cruzi]RNC47582.1 putative protein kinase [Trypanosoma cruzi]|eukprot:XP_811940.1 protein kinase [Trypanosoma cruzi strain CL Brener]
MLNSDGVERRRLQCTASVACSQSVRSAAGGTEKSCAAPRRKFEGSGAEFQRAIEEVTRDVVDFNSLSMEDISLMRLRGCRAMASRGSSLFQQEIQKQHSGKGPFPMTSHMSMSSLHSTSFVPAENLTALFHNVQDADSYPHQGAEGEVKESALGAQLTPGRVDDGEENDDDFLSGIHAAADTEAPEVGPRAFQRIVSQRLFSFQLENSESFEVNVSSIQGKRTFPPSASPRQSRSSSHINLTPGSQLFSTWKFPVLGKVEGGPPSVFWHGEQKGIEEEERVSAENDGGREEKEEKEGLWTSAKQNDTAVPAAITENANGGGDELVGKGGKKKVHDDDKMNARSLYFSEEEQERRYMKLLRFVYALYESMKAKKTTGIAANAPDEFSAASLRDPSQSAVRLLHPRVGILCPSLSSTMIGAPSGYYSLGTRPSMQHGNKQFVPVLPPPLDSFSIHHNDTQVHGFPCEMDPHIVSLIEQRPLLQTTVFVEFAYRKCHQRMRGQEQLRGRSESFLGSGPTCVPSNSGKLAREEENLETESKEVTHLTPNAEETDLPVKLYVADALLRGVSGVGAAGASIPQAAGASVPLMVMDEPPITVHRRLLTQVRAWKRKVHPIDETSRIVDNEEDNLVVYVGMILMGWLEVVDILGAGTFGQVFLCKDLRVADGHFLHPSEIEGEDFQYWQCSHEYIPFGDPSMVPTHPPLVAVKVAKSRALFEQQSILEAEMLVYIGAQTAPQQNRDSGVLEGPTATTSATEPPESDPRCKYVAKVFAHGMCYGHHCIVMERCGANLFEFLKSHDFRGFPMYQIQAVGRKILLALMLLHEQCHVVHGDIKPENVLLTLDSCLSAATVHGAGAMNTGSGHGNHISTADGKPSCVFKAPLEASRVLLGESAKINLKNSMLDAPASKNTELALPAPSPFRIHNVVSLKRAQNAFVGKESTVESKQDVEGAATETQKIILSSLKIKIIDFSSSFYVGAGIYTYLQSRYYRAPEVILGARYGPPIDIWSTGCLLAELLLGLPLLPGSSDFHQLYLMEEMLGPLPPEILVKGMQTANYYNVEYTEPETGSPTGGGTLPIDGNGERTPSFSLFREEEYRARHENVPAAEWRCYFQYRTLAELLRNCTLSVEEKQIALGRFPTLAGGDTPEDMAAAGKQRPIKAIVDEMMQQRFLLYDLLKKMLHGDSSRRLTAREALVHPFFVHTPNYMQPYHFVTE